MFQQIAEGIWTTARPQKFWGFEVGTRMTIVRLSSGGLFVHCPVALDAPTRAEVAALGPVVAVASSSLYHHLYAGDWMRAYPDAVICACPKLQEKRPDLRFSHVLSDEPLAIWERDLQQVYVSSRFEHEVVFFHPATKTMICADALLNLTAHPQLTTRIGGFMMANTAPGKGYLERIAVQHWRRARGEIDRILQWDIDAIVLAHGGLVEHDGRNVVADAYAWLPGRSSYVR